MSLTETHRVDHTDEELAQLSEEFERWPASKIIRWAVDSFGHHLAMSASMTDAVLIDLATKVDPAIEVIFIDTGYHFPETLATVEEVRRHYGLNLRMMTVARQEEELWEADPENCCSAVKVGQLDRALASKDAWMSGLRRDEATTRGRTPIVARDLRGLVKINPIALWSDDDVEDYIAEHDIIVNPLTRQGYPSIGCMPCTTPVAAGRRSSRRALAQLGQDRVRPAPLLTGRATRRGGPPGPVRVPLHQTVEPGAPHP